MTTEAAWRRGARVTDLATQPRSIRRRLRRHVESVRRSSVTRVRARLRERIALHDERWLLEQVRDGRSTCVSDADLERPLVTVRITTYNRGPVLVENAIASALVQTYDNLEVLVIGDACDDDTDQLVRSVADPRVRFINLPHRPIYPTRPADRWMVNAYAACNLGLELARGAWIAPCDDDDELTPHHVESLLETARRERAEFVHSRTAVRVDDDAWGMIGRAELSLGQVTHGAVMYSTALRFMRYNNLAWQLGEPLDWNLFKRMARVGVRMAYLDDVTYLYYPSGATALQYQRLIDRALTRDNSRRGRLRALLED